MQVKLSIVLTVAFCALLGATGQLFFKLASKTISFSFFSLISNWKLLVGLLLYGIATILFVFSLKHGNLSILYPIIASSYIWVTFFSVIFLGESFIWFKWIGIFLILGGITIIVMKNVA